jgi:hypothetical protein
MKNLLCKGLLGALIAILFADGQAVAFHFSEIYMTEYRTEGTAKQKLVETGSYVGSNLHQGYWIIEDNVVIGFTEFSTNYMLFQRYGITLPYVCKIQGLNINWDKKKNILKSSYTVGACFDHSLGAPRTFLYLQDCTLQFKFSDPSNFSGKLKCVSEEMNSPYNTKFNAKFKGEKMGTYPH